MTDIGHYEYWRYRFTELGITSAPNKTFYNLDASVDVFVNVAWHIFVIRFTIPKSERKIRPANVFCAAGVHFCITLYDKKEVTACIKYAVLRE